MTDFNLTDAQKEGLGRLGGEVLAGADEIQGAVLVEVPGDDRARLLFADGAVAPVSRQVETLPALNLRSAVPHLRRPFAVNAVKWKVQVASPANNPSTALVVPYIDARLVVERLNAVCPDLWHEGGEDPEREPPFRLFDGGIICRLTIDGVTRQDVGSGYDVVRMAKGLWSDGLKRVAVKFGIGVSLYAIPKIKLLSKDEHVRLYDPGKEGKKGRKALLFTDAGEVRVREIYEEWLEAEGVQTFGEVLDHGDAIGGSLGDVEGEGAPLDAETAEAAAEEEQESAEAKAGRAELQKSVRGKKGTKS